MRISDWSSDVCSSDLSNGTFAQNYAGVPTSMAPLWSGHARLEYTHSFSDRDVLRVTGGLKYSDKYIVNAILPQPDYLKIDAGVVLEHGPVTKSEGRRVGKERGSKCRYRWSPVH